MPTNPHQPIKLLPRWNLLLILLAALVARLLTASLPNFSVDESFSFFLSSLKLRQIFDYLPLDRHPPLYYLFLHGIVSLGHSEFLLRLPSILFSLGSIFLVYRITRLLSDSEPIALMAALFSALFFSSWVFDTVARMFSMANLFQLAATFFWIRILIKNDTRVSFCLSYLLSMALASYTLHFSNLILIGHFLSLLFLGPKQKRAWLTLLSFLLINLPSLYLLKIQMHGTEIFNPWDARLQLAAFYPYFLGIIPLLQSLIHLRFNGNLSMPILLLSTLLLLAVQIGPTLRFAKKEKTALQFFLILSLSYLIPLVLGSLVLHKFNLRQRYFLLLYPYVAILLSISINNFRASWTRIFATASLIGINLILLFNFNLVPTLWGYDLKPFATLIQQNEGPDMIVAAYVPTTSFFLFNYYCDYRGVHFIVKRNGHSRRFLYSYEGSVPEFYIPENEIQWNEALQEIEHRLKHRMVWLLINEAPWMDPDGFIHDHHSNVRKLFARKFRVQKSFRVKTLAELSDEDTYFLYELTPK